MLQLTRFLTHFHTGAQLALPPGVIIGNQSPSEGGGGGDGGSYESSVLVVHGFHGAPSLKELKERQEGFVPPVTDFVISKVSRGAGGMVEAGGTVGPV